jgi:hypothetical protein
VRFVICYYHRFAPQHTGVFLDTPILSHERVQ